jgi:hypothetical protein
MSYALLSRKNEAIAPPKAKAPSKGLRLNPANDSSEHQADRAADGVMAGHAIAPVSKARAKSTQPLAPPIIDQVLSSSGRPLDSGARQFFETRFGHDFGRIRVHTGGLAAESATATNALAYTVGSNLVFSAGAYAPETEHGRRLIAHELAHTLQQSGSASAGVLQRTSAHPAGAAAEFDQCDQPLQDDLRAKQGPALALVDQAIAALANGWTKMAPAHQAVFQRFFDPAGSGQIDDGFVSDVRANYGRIRGYMSSLQFDCNLGSRTICGTGNHWCVGGRLMWTCFGALHVCPKAYLAASDSFKIETMIHESTHNALHTTDRGYSNEKDFKQLTPRGHGFLHFLSGIPLLGRIFRLFRSNNDTLYNPDSYSGFAGGI